MNRKTVIGILGILLITLLFIGSSYLANSYKESIQSLITSNNSVVGMIAYVLITTIAIVVAPISTLPLIPIAVSIWGWFLVGILSIIGWVIGSQIAFMLARRFGKSFIQKFYSLEKLQNVENKFSQKNIFWTVVFLRLTVPVDVLSYALGLFSTMSHRAFFLATLLGVTPFAFVFSYLGSLPPGFQLISLIEILLILLIIRVVHKRISNKE